MMQLKAHKEQLSGELIPSTLNEEQRTVDVTWSTGAKVRRFHPEYGDYFEALSLDPECVRLERFESGAPVLNNHQSGKLNDQIGVVQRAWLEGGKGYATIKFSDREDVKPIFSDVKNGIFRNISVGYKSYKLEEIPQDNDLPILRSVDTEFFELSLVPINADAGAQIRSESDTYVANIINHRGESMKKTENNNKKEEVKKDPLPTQLKEEQRSIDPLTIVNEERLRIRAIEEKCNTHSLPIEFKRKLIDDGVSESQANQLILDELTQRSIDNLVKNQGSMPRIQAGELDEVETRREAIKDAIVHNYNSSLVDLKERSYEYVGRSVTDIIRQDLEKRGEKVGRLNNDQLVTRAFHSTSDFPLIMAQISDVTLKQSYQNLVKQQTFRPLVRYQNAKDFRPMHKMQMGEIPSFEKIPEGAEVSYGTISANSEQWSIASYGKAFSVTRELLINDNLNLVMTAMSDWGAAAARLESNMVWGLFKQNPRVNITNNDGTSTSHRWFSAENKNISPDAPLTLDAIEDAEYLMSIQRGNDEREGDELNITPTYLIVPSRLKNTARKLIYGIYTPNVVDNVNIYQNQFQIISEARLNPDPNNPNAKYPWYLATSPNELPVMWMAYLNGVKEPQIQYDTDFSTRSIRVRADIDFGVTHGEHRAVHRNGGATRADQLAATNLSVPGANQ